MGGQISYSKELSDRGLQHSVSIRRERAEIKRRLKAGELAPWQVLDDKGPVTGKIRLFSFLSSCPGIGSTGSRRILRALGLPESKTLRSLGRVQKVRVANAVEMVAGGMRPEAVAEAIASAR